MATRPKAVIESRNGEKFSPITIAKNVLTDNGQNLHDILSDRKEDMMTPTIENSSSMFKVGQGDNVDYSSNVVNGAYESCVLKGKTMVNVIQEPSSQDVVLPYAFEDGQYVTINDTKESGALGVKLKGQTLVNLSNPHEEREIVFNTRYQVYNVTNDVVKGGLKNGEKIFMSMEVNVHEINIETANFRVGTCRGTGGYDHIIKTNTEIHNLPKNTWVRLCTIREVNEEQSLEQYSFWFGMRGEHPTTDKEQIARVSFRNPVWINLTSMFGSGKEPTLTDCEKLPYFTGMSSCKMPILHTTGKNLFDYSSHPITLEKLAYADGQQVYWTGYIGVKTYVPVKENTTYTYSNDINVGIHFGLVFYDDDKSVLSYINNFKTNNSFTSFTTPKGCKFIRFAMETQTIPQWIQLEEATSPTSYESYKSSILSLPEEVVLRGIGDVKDTLNLTTGEYVQRIGSITANELEASDYYKSDLELENTIQFGMLTRGREKLRAKTNAKSVCNIIPIMFGNDDVFHARVDGGTPYGSFTIWMDKTKLETEDVFGLIKWLRDNNAVIQYELATPIVTKINLPSTLKSWNTTTHIYSKIPENTLYPILSHSNPTYPVIIKPSTKYSIVASSYSNGHTNSAINFNLGGATASTTVGNRVTTITTPSTLSNELLTMSGRGNKLNSVMVIEGDVVGDEPYFEGMCDSKSPILSNVGKNLFDASYVGNYEHWETDTGVAFNNYPYIRIQLKQNTNYVFTRNDTNNPSKTGRRSHIVVHTLENKNSGEWLYHHESPSLNQKEIKINTSSSGVLIFANSTCGSQTDLTDMMAGFSKSMIEESSSATTYEPYKSNTTTFNQKDDKTIVLRSLPNGVCDTLNVRTGEYVQNIGETVLDGSDDENWSTNNTEGTTTNRFISPSLQNSNVDQTTGVGQFLCDKLKTEVWNQTSRLGLTINGQDVFIYNASIDYSASAIKQWLSQNPVTVQYQLATPIVKQVNVEGYPYAYENGHVILSSGSIEQSLTPKVEYSVATNRNGQIRSNQKMVERHQKQLDRLQAMILTNLVNTQYEQTLTNLKYDLKNVREEVK